MRTTNSRKAVRATHDNTPPDGKHAHGGRRVKPTRAQLSAIAELIETTPLVLTGLDIRIGSYDKPSLRGMMWLTVRDHWAVEHFRIDRRGLITRPWEPETVA